MRTVQRWTQNALQQQTLVLPDGTAFTLQIYFRPIQKGWFINSLVYGAFSVYGLRITNNPNLLYQWRNKLPFGLACYSTDNREPSLIGDFESGASTLYVLTPAEMASLTKYLQNG